MFVCLSVCLSLSLSPYVSISISLSPCVCVCVCVCVCACERVCLSINLYINQSINQSINLSIYLSVYLSTPPPPPSFPSHCLSALVTCRRLPEKLEVTDYESLGFVHFPRDDGVEPNNPESGWWNIINSRDMQEGDFCFSPIFIWNVNEPVTLKIHGIVPVFAPAAPSFPGAPAEAGAARERVGAYVVGFKLHFLSKALQNLDHQVICLGLQPRPTLSPH